MSDAPGDVVRKGVGRLKQFRGTVITPVYGRLKLTEIRNDNKQRRELRGNEETRSKDR